MDTLAQCRILVVDDYQDSADSLAMLLELWDHQVETAYDGDGALEIARDFRPDVVLLDLAMPKLGGYEVARRLREQPGGDHIHIIAMTGFGQGAGRRHTLERGFDQHLLKPVDEATLKRALSLYRAVAAKADAEAH